MSKFGSSIGLLTISLALACGEQKDPLPSSPEPIPVASVPPSVLLQTAELTDQLRPAYEDWLQKHVEVCKKTQKNQGGGLMNLTNGNFHREDFIKNPKYDLDAHLQRFTSVEQPQGYVFERLEKPVRGFRFVFRLPPLRSGEPSELWYVGEAPAFPDEMASPYNDQGLWLGEEGSRPHSTDPSQQGPSYVSDTYLYVCRADGTGQPVCSDQASFRIKEVFAEDYVIEWPFLRFVTQQAKKHGEREAKPDAQSFDLPKDRPIGYLAVQEADSRRVAAQATAEDAKHLPFLLQSKGYQIQLPSDYEIRVNADTKLKDQLAMHLRNFKGQGIQDCFLKIDPSNGFDQGTSQKLEFSGQRVPSQDVLEVLFAPEFNGMNVTLMLSASFTGGMARLIDEASTNGRTRSGRLILVTESAASSPAYEGRLNGGEDGKGKGVSPEPFSTVYFNAFVCALGEENDSVTFGLAHYQAAQRTQNSAPADPELWSIGGGVSAVTWPVRSNSLE